MKSSDDLLELSRATFPKFANRAVQWRLRTCTLQFERRPLLMGIINVTPDSFSDGGEYFDVDRAVERGLQLVEQGADVLDVGGESTRPYSSLVEPQEELRRIVPVITRLCESTNTPLSVDTSKSVVAREALSAGAEIINDVTGLEADADMVSLAAETEAAVCAMHMQGTPRTMQVDPTYKDVVEDIHHYLRQRQEDLVARGVDSQRICLDPGIGFGKTHQHNLTLLAHCGRYHDLGAPLLVGHSRKGFIGKVLGERDSDRAPGTVGVALALARQGVQMLRVHDVAPVYEALLLFDAAGGIDGRQRTLP